METWMSDKPYRSVRQPLKTEIFMLIWMSTESIHNDRLSSVGSSALGREPFPILLWSKVSKGVCGTLFVEESNIFGDLPRDIICRCDVQICKQLGLYPSVDGFHGGIVRRRAGSGHCNAWKRSWFQQSCSIYVHRDRKRRFPCPTWSWHSTNDNREKENGYGIVEITRCSVQAASSVPMDFQRSSSNCRNCCVECPSFCRAAGWGNPQKAQRLLGILLADRNELLFRTNSFRQIAFF